MKKYRIAKGTKVWKIKLSAAEIFAGEETWDIYVADEPIPTLIDWVFDDTEMWAEKSCRMIFGEMDSKPREGQIIVLPSNGITTNCNAFLVSVKDIIDL